MLPTLIRWLFITVLLPLGLSAAVELWPNLDGEKTEAELIARKGDYVSFKKTDGSRYLYPYQKLTPADKTRVDALEGGTPEANATPSSAKESSSAKSGTAPAASNKFARQLAGQLVAIKEQSLSPVSPNRLDGIKFYAVYFSAQWGPPCRAFTPELVAFYKKIKASHPEFELIFVSADRDEKAMTNYMIETGMPWLALRQGNSIPRPDYENGIPNLVFVDANGKDLSTSYTSGGEYEGPHKVMEDIRQHFHL